MSSVIEETAVDAIERWVWTQNLKGRGFEVEFEAEIHPLNESTFEAFILPAMFDEQAKKLPTLERYRQAYPDRTHFKLRRGKGSKEWSVEVAGSLAQCRPHLPGAQRVDDFDSREPAAVEPVSIRRQRVTDPDLEELGWVLSLEEDGWHALNTIRKHHGRSCYSEPGQAEQGAANLQDAFDRKVLGERDSAESGWIEIDEPDVIALPDPEESESPEPATSDAEAAFDALPDPAVDETPIDRELLPDGLDEAIGELVNRALINAFTVGASGWAEWAADLQEGLSDVDLQDGIKGVFRRKTPWINDGDLPHFFSDANGLRYVIALPDGEPAIWVDTTGPFGDPELSGIYLVDRVRQLLNVRRPDEFVLTGDAASVRMYNAAVDVMLGKPPSAEFRFGEQGLEVRDIAPVQTLHPVEPTAKPLPTGEIYLPLSNVFASPLNPRKHFDEEYIASLAESIKESGLINAIVVRVRYGPLPSIKIQPSLPDGTQFFDLFDASNGEMLFLGSYNTEQDAILATYEYEIVAGECRWRAHAEAEIGTIRARIVDISDAEMRIVQLEENIKRKDLTPIEEAQAYSDALSSGEFTIETLAKRASVSRSQIRGMMKLLALPESARLALDMGGLSVSTAELIARRPNEEQRERLSRTVIAEGLSFAQVKQLIGTEYSRELKGAIFELEDAELLPAAGPCMTCPYRSGNDRETYPDGRDDVCNNPGCYSAKEHAHRVNREILEEEAMETGRYATEIDSAPASESTAAEKTWDAAFSDDRKLFAPDQPKEQPAEVEADEDDLPEEQVLPDFIAAEEPKSQPEQAAEYDGKSISAHPEKAKPAPAAPSPSANGFPLQLNGVPIHITVAIYPRERDRSTRKSVIGIRQDAAQMGGKFVVINAATLREVGDAVIGAVSEFIPSATPIARRPSTDEKPKWRTAPAKSKASGSKKSAAKKPAASNSKSKAKTKR